MTSVVILTSGELRHRFVRMCLAADDRIEVWDAKAYTDMRNETVDMSSLSENVMGPLGNDDGK